MSALIELMHKSDIIRTLFFILFFSIGAGSLGISVLCDDLVLRANSRGVAFRSVGIVIITDDMSIKNRSLSLGESATDKEILLESAKRLLEDYLRESRQDLRRIGVRVSAFSPAVDQRSLCSYLI